MTVEPKSYQISGGVQSLDKALNIVDLLDAHGELGVTEIGNLLGLDKSGVHRLLVTLKRHRYVQQSPRTRKYSNGYKLFELGSAVVERQGFKELVYPFMQALSQDVGEAVNLGILDEHSVLYLAKIETRDTLKVCLPAGRPLPLHCSSVGKVLLAFQPEEERTRLLSTLDLKSFTSRSITSKDELGDHLAQVRASGYATDAEEHILGLACLAVPLWGAKNRLVAALSVSMPLFRYESPGMKGRALAALTETGRKVSSALGA